MSLEILLGPFLVAAVLLLISSQLDQDEHFILRLLFSLFAVALLLLGGQSAIDSQHSCSVEMNTSSRAYIDGMNFTDTFTYDEQCTATTAPSTITLFKVLTWIARAVGIYAFIYLSYFVFRWFMGKVRGG